MSFLKFAKTEFAAATARGVSQCVVIGSRLPAQEIIEPASGGTLQFFDSVVPESMASVLEKSGFDKLKVTLFVWLGGAGALTAESAIATLAFIASLPKGSGVLLNYVAERSPLGSRTHSALDALASRIDVAGTFKYLIQPQAVAGMLRGLGFHQITDVIQDQQLLPDGHLVSALV